VRFRHNLASARSTYPTKRRRALAGISEQTIEAISRDLDSAERDRRTLRPITETHPEIDIDTAYKIQLGLIQLKDADGKKIVGKKIGLTSKAMQKMLNVDQPDYGHIFDSMVLQDGVVFRVAELIQPKIEPEIAFILDREIKGPGVTPMQVLAATRFVVPALETHRTPHGGLENKVLRHHPRQRPLRGGRARQFPQTSRGA